MHSRRSRKVNRNLGRVLVAVGALLALISVFGDTIGAGSNPGLFGRRQIAGTMVGVLMFFAGCLFLLSGATKKNLILALVSGSLSLMFFGFVLEVFFELKHEKWKSSFATRFSDFKLATVSTNPKLLWEYRPNAETDDPDRPRIQTNRYGFRDRDDISLAKPQNAFRISFIGDSVTLGHTVDSQSTFVSKFAAYAADKDADLTIEALNHGIDGYNTIQISELLSSRVIQFKPDKIVYVMCLNDFDFEDSSGGKLLYFNKPNSFLFREVERVYRRLLRTDFHVWHFTKNKQEVFDSIFGMKQFLDEKNIDFQIVVVPVFRFQESDKNFNAYPLSELHLAIRQFATNQHIDFIDLLESFSNQEKPPEYFSNDIWHPNDAGHDFIAKQLLPFTLKDL